MFLLVYKQQSLLQKKYQFKKQFCVTRLPGRPRKAFLPSSRVWVLDLEAHSLAGLFHTRVGSNPHRHQAVSRREPRTVYRGRTAGCTARPCFTQSQASAGRGGWICSGLHQLHTSPAWHTTSTRDGGRERKERSKITNEELTKSTCSSRCRLPACTRVPGLRRRPKLAGISGRRARSSPTATQRPLATAGALRDSQESAVPAPGCAEAPRSRRRAVPPSVSGRGRRCLSGLAKAPGAGRGQSRRRARHHRGTEAVSAVGSAAGRAHGGEWGVAAVAAARRWEGGGDGPAALAAPAATAAAAEVKRVLLHPLQLVLPLGRLPGHGSGAGGDGAGPCGRPEPGHRPPLRGDSPSGSAAPRNFFPRAGAGRPLRPSPSAGDGAACPLAAGGASARRFLDGQGERPPRGCPGALGPGGVGSRAGDRAGILLPGRRTECL